MQKNNQAVVGMVQEIQKNVEEIYSTKTQEIQRNKFQLLMQTCKNIDKASAFLQMRKILTP